MPNAITREELEDMHLPELGRRLSFKHAGWIRPLGSAACDAMIDDIITCVLYAEIVEGHVQKFGTTNSLQTRQFRNRDTINSVLAFQDGRSSSINKKITDPSTYDRFKQKAPGVIRSGKKIEIWATSLSSFQACPHPKRNASCSACCPVEAELNRRYETIQYGWAMKEN